VTILAPEVSELPKPIPIIAFVGTCILAFVVACTLDPEPVVEVPAIKEDPLLEKAEN
jgi:hypothetical protein